LLAILTQHGTQLIIIYFSAFINHVNGNHWIVTAKLNSEGFWIKIDSLQQASTEIIQAADIALNANDIAISSPLANSPLRLKWHDS
jgi:methylmalonyl-CoA mutase cobalamin-binding subunit